jgi:hypothetical protein
MGCLPAFLSLGDGGDSSNNGNNKIMPYFCISINFHYWFVSGVFFMVTVVLEAASFVAVCVLVTNAFGTHIRTSFVTFLLTLSLRIGGSSCCLLDDDVIIVVVVVVAVVVDFVSLFDE